MSGFIEVEKGRVKMIHYSTASLVEVEVKTDDPVAEGSSETVTNKFWLDYGHLKELYECLKLTGMID